MQPTQTYGSIYGKRLGWWIVLGLCLLPVFRWLMLAPLAVRFGSIADILANFGRLCGIVGLVLYALNFVLATRLKFIEDLFGGLNKVYIAHHIIGGLALIAIAFHPTVIIMSLVLFSFGEAIALLLPHMPSAIWPLDPVSAQIIALDAGLVSFAGTTVLLVMTFFFKMRYKFWLFTHKFLGPAFLIVALHIVLVNSDTSIDPILRWYLILWVIIGFGAFVYKLFLSNIIVRHYQYEVDFVRVINDGVTEFALKPTGPKMDFIPGQFVFVRFPNQEAMGIEREWHPFSISSAPQEDFLRLSIKSLGDFSQLMASVTKGSMVEIEGAYGRFSYKFVNNPHQVWVAGGIGIAPFLSMIRSLPADGPTVDLYYAATSQANLIDMDELASIARGRGNQVRLFIHPSDTLGWVTADIIARQIGSIDDKEIFLCGPEDMIKSLKREFVVMGVPPVMIHSEEFGLS